MKDKKLQTEDKRKVLFSLLSEYTDLLPKYSAADLLYSALRTTAKERGASVSFLRGITDRELYKRVEKSLRDELID